MYVHACIMFVLLHTVTIDIDIHNLVLLFSNYIEFMCCQVKEQLSCLGAGELG